MPRKSRRTVLDRVAGHRGILGYDPRLVERAMRPFGRCRRLVTVQPCNMLRDRGQQRVPFRFDQQRWIAQCLNLSLKRQGVEATRQVGNHQAFRNPLRVGECPLENLTVIRNTKQQRHRVGFSLQYRCGRPVRKVCLVGSGMSRFERSREGLTRHKS